MCTGCHLYPRRMLSWQSEVLQLCVLVTDQSCEVVMKSAASWPRTIMQPWMKRLPRTGRASRLAGGRLGCRWSLGPPFPMTRASRVTRMMSVNRNCMSATPVFTWTHTVRGQIIHEVWFFYVVYTIDVISNIDRLYFSYFQLQVTLLFLFLLYFTWMDHSC